jgi:hypothetical protein
MQNLTEIEYRLRKFGLPDRLVELHIRETAKWRAAHPQEIQRRRLYDPDAPRSAGRVERRVQR